MRSFFLGCFALLLGAAPGLTAPLLQLSFEGSTLTVENVSPGAEVAWLTTWHQEIQERYRSVRSHSGTAVDDDGDGRIEIAFREPIPESSAFVVIDLDSGRSNVAGQRQRRRRTPREVGYQITADNRAVDVQRPYAQVLLARPGAGSWLLETTDGGDRDHDASSDGKIRARLDRFADSKDGPPPRFLKGGDHLFVIDPTSLDILDLVVEE